MDGIVFQARCHAAYAPSEEEIAYATRLVEAFDAHTKSGRGIFVFEGRVIDLPVVEAPRSVLARLAPASSNAVHLTGRLLCRDRLSG
ncbi:MAG: hypothetical protein HYU51_01770 [Candidatus Rokubacteria bacterium]|nr:hypothetical protein [Candidatus Rokubacteria bacterium]